MKVDSYIFLKIVFEVTPQNQLGCITNYLITYSNSDIFIVVAKGHKDGQGEIQQVTIWNLNKAELFTSGIHSNTQCTCQLPVIASTMLESAHLVLLAYLSKLGYSSALVNLKFFAMC